MLGVEQLKEKIEITETTVECPVKGCSEKVDRQRGSFTKRKEFLCPKHNIFISPSTFEHLYESDNLLWKDSSDLELFDRIKDFKRVKHRLGRERSEDSLSWNVFRFLEKNNLIEVLLDSITDSSPNSSEVVYWSYSQREDDIWSLLDEARREFGEYKISWSSEPDIIVTSDTALYFIEAKFKDDNKTVPTNESEFKKYKTGGENWFSKVFSSEYETVAITEKKYELLRFWLLGTWIAEQQGLDFYLISLVRAGREKDIEAIFGKHIKENQRRKFLRVTWETIFQYISESEGSSDKKVMMRYFRNKTIGYKMKRARGIEKGILQKAFSIL